MSTEPATLRPLAHEAGAETDRITYGAVHLDVVDLDRSLSFWCGLVGLGVLSRTPLEAALGTDADPLLVLRSGAARPAGRGHAGLYHLALHLPDEVEFARVLGRLLQARVPQSPTDHVFSKATYLNDPDAIMLELTLETPARCRSVEIGPHSVALIDSDGRRRGATEPLDLATALAPLEDGALERPLPPGTFVGHVHLHVPDLRDANAFYRDVVGFEEHAYMAPIGMADLSAGGAFPHRIALNSWNGPDARQAPEGTAGMSRFELYVRDAGQLEELARRAGAAGARVSRDEQGSVSLSDPAANEILIRAAA